MVWGRESVRFSRVYDSRIAENPDFGPGWRLSLISELHRMGGELVFLDASGAGHRFLADADGGYVGAMPQHADVRISIEGSTAEWQRDGELERVFQILPDGDRFTIVRRNFGSGARFHYDYRDGLLRALRSNTDFAIKIERDERGRVASAIDSLGRKVAYSYDADGRLQKVRDVAGNDWTYEYDASGRLTAAFSPTGKLLLSTAYDDEGKVVDSRSDRTFFYAYSGSTTTVTDGTGKAHVFKHDAKGATKALRSTTGVSWRISFDGRHRVRKLILPDRSYAYTYAPGGQVASVLETSPTDRSRTRFDYDAKGRLIASMSPSRGKFVTVDYTDGFARLTDASGGEFQFGQSKQGDLLHARARDGTFVVASYDDSGALDAFYHDTRAIHFERDPGSRISSTRFADGTVNRYTYDSLGNRRWAEYGRGGAVRYVYDATGNLVEIDVRNPDGSSSRQTVGVGDFSRIERITNEESNRSISVEYGPAGNPAAFDFGNERVRVLYNGQGEPESAVFESTGSVRPFDMDRARAKEKDRVAFEDRLSVLSRDSHGMAHADHGVVGYDEPTFDAVAIDPLELGVPGLKTARQLLRVAAPLFGDHGAQVSIQQFEKPSNPVFQSNEYRSVNCCISPRTILKAIGDKSACIPKPHKPTPPVAECNYVSTYSLLNRSNCDAGIVQGKSPTSNGCSTLLPIVRFRSVFTSACNSHDLCYGTCRAGKGSCDTPFLSDMQALCGSTPLGESLRRQCWGAARAYYDAVDSALGIGFFERAQVAHCKCCSEPD